MSDKLTCPACNSYSSANAAAYARGEQCPSCGLPAEIAQQIFDIRESTATEVARQAAEQALAKLGTEQATSRAALFRLAQVRDALVASPPDWWQPTEATEIMAPRLPADRLRFLARQLTPPGDEPLDPTVVKAVAMGLRTLADEQAPSG